MAHLAYAPGALPCDPINDYQVFCWRETLMTIDGQTSYSFLYDMKGATVGRVTANTTDSSLVINIENQQPTSNGTLTFKLARAVMDSTIGDHANLIDKPFEVLVDGQVANFTELQNINHNADRILQVQFGPSAKQIRIIGTYIAGEVKPGASEQPILLPMSGGQTPLDVGVTPVWAEGGQVYFKLEFYEHGNKTLLRFVHYDLKIFNQTGNAGPAYDYVESHIVNCPVGPYSCSIASADNGTATVPAVPWGGSVTLGDGQYRVEIDVYGFLNATDDAVNPAKAELPIQVTPEFASAEEIPLAALVIGVIVCLSSSLSSKRE